LVAQAHVHLVFENAIRRWAADPAFSRGHNAQPSRWITSAAGRIGVRGLGKHA